jgi:hypothetical protein
MSMASETQTAALSLGVEIKLFDVRADADIEPAFASATNWQAGALLMGGMHHELDPTGHRTRGARAVAGAVPAHL